MASRPAALLPKEARAATAERGGDDEMRNHRGPLTSLALLGLFVGTGLLGCSGDDDPTGPAASTGTLAIDVQGLPAGTDCTVGIHGPDFFSATATGDVVFEDVAAGDYGITSGDLVDGYLVFETDPSTRVARVEAGATTTVELVYAGATARGHLDVAVDGLPDGLAGLVRVTGPNGFESSLEATTRLESLLPGSYGITTTTVIDGTTAFVPAVGTFDVTVVAGETADGTVAYQAEELGDVDFAVTGVEIVQATQRADGTVPLIRGREALLRVYVTVSENTPFVPDVGLEIRVNGDLVDSPVVTPDYTDVPTSTARGDLTTSVNWTLPAGHVQPGLTVRATVDPTNAFVEANEDDNVFPDASSSARGFAVASLDVYGITLVPVHQSVNGETGDVDASNASDYVSKAEAIYPVPSVAVTVHATLTTDAPALASNDGSTWGNVLLDVQALRALEDSDDNYYGVVSTTYNSGIAGYGYIPSSRSSSYRTAIGWDKPNSRNGVAAHELGHNLGRSHVDCGGPQNPDPAYPYDGGRIGQWGFDQRSGRLVDPEFTDIMGYCNDQWISDYNFEQILTWLGGTITPARTATQPCVMVWGRVQDGALHLEPAVVVETRPVLPAAPGDFLVDVLDADGAPLASLSFDPPRVGCAEDATASSFAWAIPVSAFDAARVGTVAVRGRGSVAVQESRTSDATAARKIPRVLSRVDARTASLRWDATHLPLAIVRDASTGDVVAIGRDGDLDFRSGADRFDVVFSDGARTLNWSHALD